jgi:DNA-binding NarL/FixJ family response regulator
MNLIRVLLADDHPVVRNGLKTAIDQDSELRVIGEACDGESAIQQSLSALPNVVVLDIKMPLVNGIVATRRIKEQKPETGVVVLTAHDSEDLFRAAMEAGANGYLTKDIAMIEITAAIRAISNGGCYVTQSMVHYLTTNIQLPTTDSLQNNEPFGDLTPMERRLIGMIAKHYSNKEIASELGLSVRTVENRRAAICEKLGLHGPNALLRFAHEHKL